MTLSRAVLAWLLLISCAPLAAQEVRLDAREGSPAVDLARSILADARYLRIDRDTILPADFRAPGDLVVLDAEVRLEGTVEGRVAVLGGDLFVRQGARVRGPIAVVGGAVYTSGLAEVGEIVEDSLPRRVAITPAPDGRGAARVRVHPPVRPSPLALPGIAGVRLPTYDRVNGLTLTAGPRWLIAREDEGARADAWASYHTARGTFGGGVEVYAPAGGTHFTARAARETLTNEEWVRGALTNTLIALALGRDERNYYESDRLSLTVGRTPHPALPEGATEIAPRVTLLLSRDRALAARDPWSLAGDLDRPNLPAEEGTVASAALGATLRWRGKLSTFDGDASLERAFPEAGAFEFTRWVADGAWASQALRLHQVAVRFHAQGAFGDPAPRQRWSFVGGPNTLPTFGIAEQRGDHVAFVESSYGIPVTRVVLPLLGSPTLRLTHRTGAAWVSGEESPPWLQNLGAGLYFSFLRAEVYVDPAADRLSPQFSAGLILPGGF